ncbi:MAG: 4Fe-4S binding protein [Myxococcota bacterium]|nr:4Fe-4S binding protein [Myxococcota bacterium]
MSELIQIQGLGPLTQPQPERPLLKILKVGTIVSCLATVLTAQLWPAIASIFWWLSVGLGTVWAWQAGSRVEAHHRQTGLWFQPSTSRGPIAWCFAVVMTGFYVVLYWWESWFPRITSPLKSLWVSLEPLSQALRNAPSDKWFLYGTLYTLFVAIFGVRMLRLYRGQRYHQIRTFSLIIAQTLFAFALPGLLRKFSEREFYLSYFWPLKPEYLFPSGLDGLLASPSLGRAMAWWTVLISLVGVPVLTYFVGKRWYCSWICGCGGLAETLGDPFRHLSNRSQRAWVIEKWMIHSVLGLIVVITLGLWYADYSGTRSATVQSLKQWYGFWIGAAFSGVVGVGFYPILGSRVWCRFGCPQAAILGLIQRWFSRFRITTNGGQCISCGNCSAVCEMGIDVKAYAQEEKDIVRASCVGCGMCATSCPRGVLKLENGPRESRAHGKPGPLNRY